MENDIPPYSLEAEQGVLGSMLISPGDCIPCAQRLLKGVQMRSPSTATCFRAIVDMHEKEIPVDIITLTDYLRSLGKLDGVGDGEVSGAAFVNRLFTQTPTSANLDAYAETVRENANVFHVWQVCRKLASQCLNPAPGMVDAISGEISRLLSDLTANGGQEWPSIGDLVGERLEFYEAANTRTGPPEDIYPTGIAGLDAMIEGGLGAGEYVVITAKTSGGKSALAGQIAVELAVNQGCQVLIASYEMSAKQLVDRMITLRSSIPGTQLRSGRINQIEFERLATRTGPLASAGLHIRDRIGSWTVDDVVAQARAIKAKHGLHLVVVDYVQLIRNASANRRSGEVENTSRALIELAKDENIIVIGLSQLNKEGGTYQSATIGFDADLAINIEPTEPPDDKKRILNIIKNRNGKRDIAVEVNWFETLTRFS